MKYIIFFLFFGLNASTQEKEIISIYDLDLSFWQTLPNPVNWTSDFEKLFTPEEEAVLNTLVADFEKKTSVEIAVITIRTSATPHEKFDELALHIANKWAVGKPNKNNGILILISKGHRRIRIETGLAIEQLISDLEVSKIIEENFIPNYKNGNYFEGTKSGLSELIKLYLQKTKID
ncbi:TPM domain-containing protein [Flavobacterium sp. J372]|uniref:TPM domain-containing protein n=1 Tax=Flavobacterium sp. J372 TaxID=2898436 RepID=UPI0021515696|nr:TPM domain-containing protein [Flavobacterium sp. J372]MCR5860996.1 TPM domain-containing protein [Flavobacterium sp. J372]